MHCGRLVVCLVILITTNQVLAKNNNPFDKAVVVSAGENVAWQYGEQTATKSVQGSDGTWYHLFYDGLRLRLRLTTSADDSVYRAKTFADFAVYDVKIDGKRVDVFQWCLNNQDEHSRFLQQGLSVNKDICRNVGGQGTFVMRLTQQTVAALNDGTIIEYELKPYRTTVRVKFSIADFDLANNEFKRQRQASLAADKPNVAPPMVAIPGAAPVPVQPKPIPLSKPKTRCKLHPPAGFAEIQSIEYDCNDFEQRIDAQAKIDLQVDQIYMRRSEQAAEAEAVTKQREATLNRQQAEAARQAAEALKQEQAALATSAEVQAELSSDIAKKMIAVCQKSWSEGKHRCYCEKYIKFAPDHIESDPDCK